MSNQTQHGDLTDGIESVETMADLSAWLKGRPDRVKWLSKFAGLDGGKPKDLNVSAMVETELSLPGPSVYASIDADTSAEAFRLAEGLNLSAGTPVYIKHTRSRVARWKTDEKGKVVHAHGLPVAESHVPVYKREQFYRANGSQPRVRDEFWTDARGYILPEVEQDQLSFKYEHGKVGIARDEHLPMHEPVFYKPGEHAAWWHRRSSVIGTDEKKVVGDSLSLIKLEITRLEKRQERKQFSEELALRGLTEAPSVDPVVEPEDIIRLKPSELDRLQKHAQRKLDRMFQYMTGERAALEAQKSEIQEKRKALLADINDWKVRQKVARVMYKQAKAAGLGYYTFPDHDVLPGDETWSKLFGTHVSKNTEEHGSDALAPLRGLKREINLEVEFRREELEFDQELRTIERKLI